MLPSAAYVLYRALDQQVECKRAIDNTIINVTVTFTVTVTLLVSKARLL